MLTLTITSRSSRAILKFWKPFATRFESKRKKKKPLHESDERFEKWNVAEVERVEHTIFDKSAISLFHRSFRAKIRFSIRDFHRTTNLRHRRINFVDRSRGNEDTEPSSFIREIIRKSSFSLMEEKKRRKIPSFPISWRIARKCLFHLLRATSVRSAVGINDGIAFSVQTGRQFTAYRYIRHGNVPRRVARETRIDGSLMRSAVFWRASELIKKNLSVDIWNRYIFP